MMADSGARFGRRQEAAIEALLTQGTIEKAARAAGIGTRTLHRWLRTPEFQAAYRQVKHDVFSHSLARLQYGSSAAATALLKLTVDPETPASVRVRAADRIFHHAMKAREIEAAETNASAAEGPQGLPMGPPLELVAMQRAVGADLTFGEIRALQAPLVAMLPEPARLREPDRLREFFEDQCQVATEGDVNSWKKGSYWVPVVDLYPRYVAWAAAACNATVCPKGSFEDMLQGLGRKKARVRPDRCRGSKQIWVWLGIRFKTTEPSPV